MRFETSVPLLHTVEPTTVNSVDKNTEEDLLLDEFRIRINNWKLKTLLPDLSNRKNNAALYEKCALSKRLSLDLANRINGRKGDPEFDEVANYLLGPLEVRRWTTDFTSRIRHILSTDLYEYPLTFDKDLIQTFKNRNYPMFE